MIHSVLFVNLWFMLCDSRETAAGKISENTHPMDHSNTSGNVKRKTLDELITKYGYSLEDHCVQTSDGYLLSVHRIPYGKKSNSMVDKRGVVLFVHGIFVDASIWVVNPSDRNLAFILSDAAYDVWMLNTRGCKYSQKHVKYNTDEQKFWDFSFDEIAQYDIPATIDYILNTTGETNLYLIGNSQGSAASFAMLSELPDYNKKVKLFIALAPVAFVGNVDSPLVRFLIPIKDGIAFVMKFFGSGEFLPASRSFREKLCSSDNPHFCENLLLSLEENFKPRQLNKIGRGVYFSEYISDTSTKSVQHFAQMFKSKTFRKYDYGRRRNLKYYNQEEPPEYDVSRITTPVALIWSANDKIADSKDIDILRRKLNYLVFDYCVPDPYHHSDFFWAENMPKLIAEPILKLLDLY